MIKDYRYRIKMNVKYLRFQVPDYDCTNTLLTCVLSVTEETLQSTETKPRSKMGEKWRVQIYSFINFRLLGYSFYVHLGYF